MNESVRGANEAYILVDANGAVPLPFHTLDKVGDAVRIVDYRCENGGEIYVADETGLWETLDGWCPAEDYNLCVITEAEYMEKQS